ncbi:MAG: DUF2911 domain-containing protein [Bacteroidia bacterium]
MKNLLLLILAFLSSNVIAQITTPRPSPLCSVEQKVGLTDIGITYSRPSMKDRVIFGELVAYDKMWRTGANASTKISFSDAVRINNTDVPAGTYALYTIPGEDEWTIILHKNLSYWGTGGDKYNEEEDQIRFTVVPNNNYKETIETMTMNLANLTSDGCDLELLWANTQVKFAIEVSYDATVMEQIEKAMTISASTYYSAARYYLENDKDLNQALEWIEKATEDGDYYWYYRQKALIQAKLGMYHEAIESAMHSKELAAEAGNDNYVKSNEDSIEEWKTKL